MVIQLRMLGTQEKYAGLQGRSGAGLLISGQPEEPLLLQAVIKESLWVAKSTSVLRHLTDAALAGTSVVNISGV